MKLSKPSPAMIVALIALVLATTGSAVAAVTYATNAGAVDRISAVSASSSTTGAAGKLVATLRLGSGRGRISTRFLPPAILGNGSAQRFVRLVDVPDNAVAAPVSLVSIPGVGTVSGTCTDQNNRVGIEDPRSVISFTNQSGATLDFAGAIGGGTPTVAPVSANTVTPLTINGSNTFILHLQNAGNDVLINGVVRQNGRGTAAANCFVYGQFTRIG